MISIQEESSADNFVTLCYDDGQSRPQCREEDSIEVTFQNYIYPNASLLPHSLPISSNAHNAFPSAATPLSPTPSMPSNPTAHKMPLPTSHLDIAPTLAMMAAGIYPQSSKIFSASTLFATTAHPN